MDFDELLADNHSLSINQINHSSESIFSAGNHITIDHSNSPLMIENLGVDRLYHRFTLPAQGSLSNPSRKRIEGNRGK
jgi:hypothetical protein